MEEKSLKEKIEDIRQKIIKGLALNEQRLIEAKDDGELIFSRDGKIVKVKARELLAERKLVSGSEQAQ